jgi:hypothetical protein
MRRTNQRTKFWTILAIINIAAIAYPISLYNNAEGGDQQISALLVLVGTGLVLAVVDAVSALMAYS